MFEEGNPIIKRLKEAMNPTPLRNRITHVLSSIKIQNKKLNYKLHQLERRNKTLYQKCVNALQTKNKPLAAIYANECFEIRKITKLTLASQLALERVTLRLETVREFGDIAHNVNAATQVVSAIKNNLQNIVPEVSMKLEEINENLESMIFEVGEVTESSLHLPPTEEAEKILAEANIIAEQKLKEDLPDLPEYSMDKIPEKIK
jgi:division protein CdvB (Snf7/Vps24/ESCRT-III family)